MNSIRVQILGSLRITTPEKDRPKLPRAAHRLIALIAAAGPDGIARDDLAGELWGEPLPESWMSALRNRVTTARKALGADTIVNDSGRFRFADTVSIDSWDLITHSLERLDLADNEMGFLDGEPLFDVEPCQLTQSHALLVLDARSALMQEIVEAKHALSPRALQSMRTFQRRHPRDAPVAIETIRGHIYAGEAGQAAMLVEEIKAHAKDTSDAAMPWIAKLDQLLHTATSRRRHHDTSPDGGAKNDRENTARADLFQAAASDGNWSLALEIALEGLPAASRTEGDPERLALLRQIPIDKLDPSRTFTYCLSMTRQLIYTGNDEEALQWCQTTRSLAETPNQQLLVYIMAAVVGEPDDERTPIPLPEAFDDAPTESVNMQSLQVAVMSHMERSSFDETAPLHRRFTTLVEASGEPYRRWHLLLIESMSQFVAGEIEAASTAAWQAFKYAQIFDILDAQGALIGQLSNARWLHPGFPGIDDYFGEFPGSGNIQLVRALQAASAASHDNGDAVHEFLRTYNYTSRSFFTLPMVALLSPHITDAALRSALATRLKARTGTSAIWGSGVLHLGPVDRTLAMLTDERVDREVHLAAAVHVADRQQLRIWQVACRLDLASSNGSQELRRQAAEMASTPALKELVASYRSRF